MIYKPRAKDPSIKIYNSDFKNIIPTISAPPIMIMVTDPPFNIGYHYSTYSDKMNENDYYKMLSDLVNQFPSVIIHYPESLYKIAIAVNLAPNRVCSWVYPSNTARQHRDIAFWKIVPNFNNAKQPYKNLNDKRIQERISRGILGGRMYDWWEINQVKNVSKEKTSHPCQMPVEVMKNIISTLPENCIVFDPFMGSGTTAIACIDLGYDFIGCEIDADYFHIAENRINERKIQIAHRTNLGNAQR